MNGDGLAEKSQSASALSHSATNVSFAALSPPSPTLLSMTNVPVLRSSALERNIGRRVGQIVPIGDGGAGGSASLMVLSYNRCLAGKELVLAWGFADCSLRLYHTDSERPMAVAELRHDGQITCAKVISTNNVIITGGMDGVVQVYRVASSAKKHYIGPTMRCLRGHEGPITCIAPCFSYSLLVTGSTDRTLIVWDLSTFTFVRRLRGHTRPLVAVAVNQLEGNIAACTATDVRIWSINGHPFVSKRIVHEGSRFVINSISLIRCFFLFINICGVISLF
mgnify:CR=1 FL=1